MKAKTRILVTVPEGSSGTHLVKCLKADGHWVRGVNIKMLEYELTAADEFELLALRHWHNALLATRQIAEVYNLAANTGGIAGLLDHFKCIGENLPVIAHGPRLDRTGGANYQTRSGTVPHQAYRVGGPAYADVAGARK